MSATSEHVKQWRKRTKERIVDALGGACVCCGYHRRRRALHTHHLDPTVKDFGLGAIRGNPKAWRRIVEELKKCVLVCSNCHAEIHDGLRAVPADAARFNPAYEDYRERAPLSPCCVCGKDKSVKQKTCSSSCAAKLRWRVDWAAIDLVALFQKYKTQIAVAEFLGVSDAAVFKRMKKLGIRSITVMPLPFKENDRGSNPFESTKKPS